MRDLPVKAEQTPAEIVRVSAPALCMANVGTTNTVFAQAIIAKLLLDTTGYFGVSWSKVQVTECAAMWASEYFWMTMAEIKLFLQWLKIGKYTKDDYRHLSPFQLMGWLGEYADELLIERRRFVEEREAAARHEKEKARLTDPSMMAFDAVAALAAIGFDPTKEAGQTADEKEEIYRQEKIKQRQRDMQLREQQNHEP